MQLTDAASTLGVHYQTAYSWVRRGVLPARKTPRGYEVSESDVQALAAQRAAGAEPRRYVRVRDWAVPEGRLFEALVAGDEQRARRDFERLAAGVPLSGLCDWVIGPALRRIGTAWAAGELSIAAEHRASAICERLIATSAQQPPGRPRGTAVTATPPGERHALPALMATACLREDRWHVHHLAADLPVGEVADLAESTRAGLVVLSSATTESTQAAQQAAGELRHRLPGVRVLAGRPGDTLTLLRDQARNGRA
jgi:MerR family transcriptional regulator, light-induced transcriptional regulator